MVKHCDLVDIVEQRSKGACKRAGLEVVGSRQDHERRLESGDKPRSRCELRSQALDRREGQFEEGRKVVS